MDGLGWYNSGCGSLQYPAGIKNNTRAAIVKQRESSITIRRLPLLPAGIKNNTRATNELKSENSKVKTQR